MNLNIKKAKNWPKSLVGGIILCALVILVFPFVIAFIFFAGLFGFISINEDKKTNTENGNTETVKANNVDGKTFLSILKEFRGIMKDTKHVSKNETTITNTSSSIK